MRALRKARGSQLLASASVMRSTLPPSRKAGHAGSLSGHAAQITARRTPSWFSGAAQPPGGTSQLPPSLRRSTASKGRFLIPLVVSEQAQLSQPYTSTTRGRASPPRGVWDRVPVPVRGPGPFCPPRRLPLRPLCLRRRRRAPPPRSRGSGHPRRLRPWRGGGWLVLGSGGLGGDEVSCVGVHVVELGVVVVVVVGAVRRRLLDAGGDAPHRLYVRLRGRPAPRPPSFPPPSPRGSRAPSCLSPGAHVALALALGSLPGPHAFVSLSTPWVAPTVTCALARTASARILPVHVPMPLTAPTFADRAPLLSMRSVAARLGALLAPLRVLPVPSPFPRSVSRVGPSAARALSPSAAAGLGALPSPSPSLLAACAQGYPLRLSLSTPPVASHPPLRVPVASTLRRLRAVPPLPDHASGVLLPLRLRPRDAWRRTLGCPGADGRWPSRREGGLGEVRLGGAGVGVAGVGVGAVLRALPALRGSCGGSRRGARGPRRGQPPRWRRAGVAVGAAARLAGVAVSAPCAPGAPSGGGAAGLAASAAGAVSLTGAGPRVDGLVSAGAARGCPAGGPTGTAASASHCSSRSARVSPAHPGKTGERERDRPWWRSSRWGEPSESDITVILVGMRGGRRALSTTSWCICGVPWAVLCSAPQGGGGEGSGGRQWRSPRAGGGRWSSIGTGAGAG